MKICRFFTDGGSRGNPGPSASAVYFPDLGYGLAYYIGESRTNNEAEALALILGLEFALEQGAELVDVRSDSKLIVNQSIGRWGVKAPTMIPLMDKVHELLKRFAAHNVQYTPRENNRTADWLANYILDKAELKDYITCPTKIQTPSSQSSDTPHE